MNTSPPSISTFKVQPGDIVSFGYSAPIVARKVLRVQPREKVEILVGDQHGNGPLEQRDMRYGDFVWLLNGPHR